MSTSWVTAAEMARATPEPIWKAVLSMPPQRLFTLTGTVVRMRVLVVTKIRETAVMLMREEGRTLTQLGSLV